MVEFAPGTVDALLAKAQAVVDALADEEANHGGLTSRETLVKTGELRLELSVWKGDRLKSEPVSTATAAPKSTLRGERGDG